jgi:hypothetical protein
MLHHRQGSDGIFAMIDEEHHGVAEFVTGETPAQLVPAAHPLWRAYATVIGAAKEYTLASERLTDARARYHSES